MSRDTAAEILERVLGPKTISGMEAAEVVDAIVGEAQEAMLRVACEEIRKVQGGAATDPRLLAACAALQGYRANPTIDQTDSDTDPLIIEWAVRDADALLARLAATAGGAP